MVSFCYWWANVTYPLQGANDELDKLKTTMVRLQNLSEQLDPLESAYSDVRFFDVDVEQTQQQYEDLMSLMDNELHDENILRESADQLRRELDRLKDELAVALTNEQLQEVNFESIRSEVCHPFFPFYIICLF